MTRIFDGSEISLKFLYYILFNVCVCVCVCVCVYMSGCTSGGEGKFWELLAPFFYCVDYELRLSDLAAGDITL
jgi:hypothetical protein